MGLKKMKVENLKEISIKSCYIHIPFCKNICSYCDFCKNYYDKKIVNKYLKSLENEIKLNYKNNVLDTLYIGGGTPSSLDFKELETLFSILNIFKLNKNYEYTFECNYEDINLELLKLLKKNRVNRLSVGIQTFNERYSDILNRNIKKEEIINKISLAKKYFNNINVDLIYALPNQSIEDLVKDLDFFVKLNINHISTYSLMIEKNTLLYIKGIKQLDDDLQNKMYYKIIDFLRENGFYHYEISNFSKKGFESKHNINYWKNNNYYGFGSGASGFINNVRYDNTKSIFNYIKGKYIINNEVLDKDMLMKDEVMLNLRMINGISKNDFKARYNISLDKAFDYSFLVDNKYLNENKNNLYINEKYLFVSNVIINKILDNFKL